MTTGWFWGVERVKGGKLEAEGGAERDEEFSGLRSSSMDSVSKQGQAEDGSFQKDEAYIAMLFSHFSRCNCNMQLIRVRQMKHWTWEYNLHNIIQVCLYMSNSFFGPNTCTRRNAAASLLSECSNETKSSCLGWFSVIQDQIKRANWTWSNFLKLFHLFFEKNTEPEIQNPSTELILGLYFGMHNIGLWLSKTNIYKII